MFLKIYADKKYKEYFKYNIKNRVKEKIFDVCTFIKRYNYATIVARGRHNAGVYTKNNLFIKNSDAHNRKFWHYKFMFFKKSIKYIDEDVVYLGIVDGGFGHFLLEYTNRLYAILYTKHIQNIKYAFLTNKSTKGVVPEYIYIYGIAGNKTRTNYYSKRSY